MKAIILVGGYGTRIEQVAQGRAKTLLDISVEGKEQPILYYLLDKLNRVNDSGNIINEIIIVTNNKYFNQIKESCDKYIIKNKSININVYNDKTTCSENRLGGNGDLQFAKNLINRNNEEDIIMLPGDNYFGFDLINILNFFKNKKAENKNPFVIACKKFNKSQRDYTHNNFAIVDLDKHNKIIKMIEKPAKFGLEINSDVGALALYLMTKQTLNKIDEFLEIYKNDIKKRDSLGCFPQWLLDVNENLFSFVFNSDFVDIGTIEEYLKFAPKNYVLSNENNI